MELRVKSITAGNHLILKLSKVRQTEQHILAHNFLCLNFYGQILTIKNNHDSLGYIKVFVISLLDEILKQLFIQGMDSIRKHLKNMNNHHLTIELFYRVFLLRKATPGASNNI